MIKEEESDYLVTSWAHFKSSRPRTSLAVSPKLCVLGIFPFYHPSLMLTQIEFIQAKRREELSERITRKLQSETALNHDIQETDRELKTLRIATETAEAVWRQKEIAVCVFIYQTFLY